MTSRAGGAPIMRTMCATRRQRADSTGGHLVRMRAAYQTVRFYAAVGTVAVEVGIYLVLHTALALPVAAAAALVAAHALVMRIHGRSDPTLSLAMDATAIGVGTFLSGLDSVVGVYFVVYVGVALMVLWGRRAWFLVGYSAAWAAASLVYSGLTGFPHWSPGQARAVGAVAIAGAAVVVAWGYALAACGLRRLEDEQSRFLGTVGHELRNDLTGVVGLSDLLADGAPTMSTAEVAEMAEMVHSQGLDAADLVEDLLTASSYSQGTLTLQIEPVNLGEEAGDTAERFTRTGPKEIDVEAGPVAVRADPLRVRQIIRNLCSNATRYGGDRVRIEVSREGGGGVVRVLDDGPGIAPGQESVLFDAYRSGRGPHRSGSVGLGLWISRRLAQSMQGDLTYRRRDDWSCFELRLPLDEASELAVGSQ